MAFAPKAEVDPYGTLRSLVGASQMQTEQPLLSHHLLVTRRLSGTIQPVVVQVPVYRGKAYGGKVLHNLKDTLKVSVMILQVYRRRNFRMFRM